MNPAQVVTRLNRHAPKTAALSFVEEQPFSESQSLRRYRLRNGLTILTMVDRSAPVVGYQTWFRIGSRDEEKGKTGLAHFFEHLMFNATKNFDQGEFDARLESAGAENNAATWTDWTQYYETLPAREISVAIELEADRMQNLDLREPQVASEREVVASERRDRVDDDVEGKANELLYQYAFKKHGYRHPTVGWMRDIKRYSVADCKAFYRRNYAPNNATLVVVGAIDEAAVLEQVQAAYGGIKSAKAKARKLVHEPAQRTERREEVRLPTSSEKLLVGYKGPALSNPDWRALSVLGDVLFGGRSSRLYKELVLDEEIASSAYGSLAPFEEPGLYEIWVGMREGYRAKNALKRLDRELKRVQRELVSESELEMAKARAELSLLSSLESISGKAEQIGFDETALRDPAASIRRVAEYRGLTREDLREVARAYFQPSLRTVLTVLPGADS